MTREDMIQELRQVPPFVIEVTATSDMGFEFSAVVPNGVIYATPGMLLDYSGREWPPNQWEGKTDKETEVLLGDFLLDETWEVTAWEDLSDEEVEEWYEEIQNT